jgi:hypothetical protein
MVEDVLIELGHFVNECRVAPGDALHAWRVVKGSAVVRISLAAGQPYAQLRVVAPVLTTDARVDVARLYRHLLNLNYTRLLGAAFATRQRGGHHRQRLTLDLDRSEVRTITRSAYADDTTTSWSTVRRPPGRPGPALAAGRRLLVRPRGPRRGRSWSRWLDRHLLAARRRCRRQAAFGATGRRTDPTLGRLD